MESKEFYHRVSAAIWRVIMAAIVGLCVVAVLLIQGYGKTAASVFMSLFVVAIAIIIHTFRAPIGN